MLVVQMIILQIITFVALVLILRKLMYSASVAETRRLQRLTEENTRKAQELARKVEEAERVYKEKLIKAEDEVKKMRLQAEEEAKRVKEEIIDKAHQEGERIVQQALSSKERFRKEIWEEMQGKNVELAKELIRTVLDSKSMDLFHRGLIQEVLEEIKKIPPEKLKSDIENVELISPRRITKEILHQVEEILSSKLGRKVVIENSLDKKIMAGIIVKLGALVIDGSLKGRLEEALEKMKT